MVGSFGRTFHWNGTALLTVVNDVTRPVGSSFLPDILTVTCVATNDVWVGGENGLVAHWDGTVWKSTKVLDGDNWWDSWSSGPADVWMRGIQDRVAHWDGLEWTVTKLKTQSFLASGSRGIWGSGPDDVWTAWGAELAHWNGTDWTFQRSPNRKTIKGIWGEGSNNILAASSDGSVFNFDGTAWTNFARPDNDGMFADIWGNGGHYFAIGSTGILHKRP